jgi:hypothetical protein
MNTHIYSSDKEAGAVLAKYFLAKGCTDGSTVGRGCRNWRRATGKQRKGKVARRSLAVVPSYEIRVSLRVRLGATQDGGGSQSEERHGMAVEVHGIDRRRKNPVRMVFGK